MDKEPSELRFTGSVQNPPWIYPEENWIEWLSIAPIEMIEDNIILGCNGSLCGEILKPDYEPQSVLLKFPRIGTDDLLDTYATELCIDSSEELINRELAAYEVMKALGNEDLALPITSKYIDTIGLLSDKSRDHIASDLKVSKYDIDQKLSGNATIQLIPRDFDNFLEVFGSYGVTNTDRWQRTTDQLRYSLYRLYFSDFILGIPIRSMSDLIYYRNADRVIVQDLRWSFTHIGYTTEKYLQMRLRGWARVSKDLRYVDDTAPTSYDLSYIFNDLGNRYLEEALMTAQQISERMTDKLSTYLVNVLLSRDISLQLIGSLLFRLSYLSFSPGSVIKRPIEIIRNMCAPIRSEAVGENAKILECVDYVNNIMRSAIGNDFDILGVVTEELPDLVEFSA